MSDSGLLRLRLPPELKARIASEAKGNNRSMNAEIVQRLEESFEPQSMAEFAIRIPNNPHMFNRRYLTDQIAALKRDMIEVSQRAEKARGTVSEAYVVPIAEIEQRRMQREMSGYLARLEALDAGATDPGADFP